MLKTTLALAATAAALAAAPAAAENVAVNGIVTAYCSVTLANVTSGTLSIAEVGDQQVANLLLKCNNANGTKLIVNPLKGDLLGSKGSINYSMRLTSEDAAFQINNTDTDPSDVPEKGLFERNKGSFSGQVASGVKLALFMNTNVNNDPGQKDFNGNPQYPATGAPAGGYEETFVFTVSPL